jgi:hypothetical protein
MDTGAHTAQAGCDFRQRVACHTTETHEVPAGSGTERVAGRAPLGQWRVTRLWASQSRLSTHGLKEVLLALRRCGAFAISIVSIILWGLVVDVIAESAGVPSLTEPTPVHRKINFVDVKRRRTPNPPGWEEYDGSEYTRERGYGWLMDLRGQGWDGGGIGTMLLPDGMKASPVALGRLELANWQGTHQENLPIVFRIDLPDGWYRATCTSVDPDNAPLPLVDQRSVKFRAHDVVFAGPSYGAPLTVEGNRLIEGSGIVEVTNGQLRIVVGDPAYSGWTWAYDGPWYRGWKSWFGQWGSGRYARGWYQKLARFVDPGFHSLRFNSLVIEQVPPPAGEPALVFRDFMNRDDDSDINAGVQAGDHWVKVPVQPSFPPSPHVDLYKTSIRVAGYSPERAAISLIQEKLSPLTGVVRYSTRVTLFTGEGSKVHSGSQEGGLLILGEANAPTDFTSTFIGIAFDRQARDTFGSVILRVGNGTEGFGTDLKISDTVLPFKITEGEHAVSVDHDVESNMLRRVQINGFDITNIFPPSSLKQRIPRGVFGIRSALDPQSSGVNLRQFYWYYRVEAI